MSHDTMLSREAAVVRRKHEEKVDDDLDTAIFAPAYERALSAGEKRSLYAEQMAPLWRQLEENPAATSAEKKLRQRIKTDIEAVKPHRKIRTGGSSSSFDIAPGTSFFTPPYDYARPGPSQGPGDDDA